MLFDLYSIAGLLRLCSPSLVSSRILTHDSLFRNPFAFFPSPISLLVPHFPFLSLLHRQTLIYPLNVIRRRLQIQDRAAGAVFSGAWDCAVQARYQMEGEQMHRIFFITDLSFFDQNNKI